MNTPSLSIVVITLNEENHLPRLLDDLTKQTWTDFEIIHVDGRSEDATVTLSRQWSSRFPHYRIIEMAGRGVSLGRNTGAAAARGGRVLFLDADSRLPRNFLADSLAELTEKALAIGIVLMDGSDLPWRFRMGFGVFNFGIRLTSGVFPTAIGACLFSTPGMHRMIGGFDEGLSLCEDCDYVLRGFRKHRDTVGILRPKFRFDVRRLEQDGLFATGLIYIHANIRRLFVGELHNNEITYEFGHYKR